MLLHALHHPGMLESHPAQPCHASCHIQAAYVAEHEEGCLAYELCMSETDPDAFIIYERCVWVPGTALGSAVSSVHAAALTECDGSFGWCVQH
jgi:quinol monooxygenase YgiN